VVSLGSASCSSSANDSSPTSDAGAASSQDGSLASDASPSDSSSAGAWSPDATNADAAAIVAARPYHLHVPPKYDSAKATPLVVMFHGYGATGDGEELYFDITETSDAQTFLYAYADGTLDSKAKRFWNATDACCDNEKIPVDDVAYFNAIVDDIAATHHVDAKRIFAIGHSNGAFMAHRLACDVAPRVAAIASLAGAVWNDPAKCQPANAVSILEVHGDADQTILYAGGTSSSGFPYPSAHATVATWAQKNGCSGALAATGDTKDLDTDLAGAETKVERYGACPTGVDVELWTIQGGVHVPQLGTPTWGNALWSFLSAHPKP
jgi:polyhydroxybutyrate depolymerase